LTNTFKHAQAGSVSIVVGRTAAAVRAVVEDDGRGFDTAARREGMGLDGMQERLALLDGRLKIESRPGGGTTLVGEVPLR
jgi:two-component system sensor kinase